MSTRSATIIEQERKKFELGDDGLYEFVGTEYVEIARFYRHCDGYPDGHGLQMAVCFEHAKPDNVPGRLWFQHYMGAFMTDGGHKGTMFERWGAPTLEFEPSDVMHGDLEYLYRLRGSLKGEITITVWAIGWDEDYKKAMGREPLFSGTPAEYIGRFGDEG